MMFARAFRLFPLALVLAVLVGCGGVGNQTQLVPSASSAPSAPISITITPTSASVAAGQTQQFQGTVSGTQNTAVNWSVDTVAGGNGSVGTIFATGLYQAPATAGRHTVTATSAADTTKSASATVTVTATAPPPAAAAAVVTRSYDNARSGVNLAETQLTPTNVNAVTFGKLFTYTVDDRVYGQPLYVPGVNIGGQTHNVIYVATQSDTAYALDADQNLQLWTTSLVNSVAGEAPIPCLEVNGCATGDVIGVTATPVIDVARNTIYVEARSKQGTAYLHKLHALDLATGAEKFGGPVTIQASVPGTGTDANAQGIVVFNPQRENDRAALLLVNNVVYLSFASFEDVPTYHGWILGYNADTLQQVSAFNTTPNGESGAIWTNNGPAADDAGNIYAVAGNGTADPLNNNFGESFLKFSAASGTLSLVDFFMPFNAITLNATDVDVGSGGLLLLPDQSGTTTPHLLVCAGKEGRIYLIDRDNMGHFSPAADQIVQSIPDAVGIGTTDRNFYSPVYFNGTVYFSGANDVPKAFSLQNGLLSTTPVMKAVTAPFTFPGGGMVLSANSNTGGILWVLEWHQATHFGTLHAYDAQDLTRELWNSDQSATRDATGNIMRLNVPLVINGKVYVSGFRDVLVYGLLP